MTILLRQKPLPQVVRQIVQRDNGAWFDPSDLSTMFQDAAGTVPVTAVEQPVGLMLDKSRGLMLGPELVSNGTFDSGISGWTVPNGGWSWDATGKARISGDGTGQTFLMAPFTLSAGKFYKVTVDLSITGGVLGLYTGADILIASGSSGKLTAYFYASTSFYFKRTSGTLTGTIDNISVRELYGYHATQPITASRPTLSARYNLLTKTEDLIAAGWSILGDASITSVDTFSTGTHGVWTNQSIQPYPSTQYTLKIRLSGVNGNKINVYFANRSSVSNGGGSQIILSSTPTDYTLTVTTGTSLEAYSILLDCRSFLSVPPGTTNQSITVHNIDLRLHLL